MEEVEATLSDGSTVLISGITVFLDAPDVSAGSSGPTAWHAHAALPLSLTLLPGEAILLETTDGRSGTVVVLDPPTIEGDRALYVLSGTEPLARSVP
jgi:hypothetical protein